jgi:predicted RNase H-like nuclease
LKSVIGVDGCRAGWFYVRLTERGGISFGVVPLLEHLLALDPLAEHILVDIPIGLRDTDGQARACDLAARKLLGSPRAASVFPSPIRAVLDAPDYDVARAQSRAITGKSPSRQAFGIFPKIREVDNLLQRSPAARSRVREAHPELCFYGLAGGRAMLHSKKTREGFEERLEVLSEHLPQAPRFVQSALAQFPRKDVARDDILDAAVCALVADKPAEWTTIPNPPEFDAVGLPMTMVYVVAQQRNVPRAAVR